MRTLLRLPCEGASIVFAWAGIGLIVLSAAAARLAYGDMD